MTSMFWGLRLEPGKRYSTTVDKSFHVSMAALDCSSLKSDGEVLSVMLEEDEANIPYILCNLNKQKLMQASLDLNFMTGDRVTFFCKGNGVVHLSGYVIPDEDDFSEVIEGEDEGEEEEEEMEVSIEKKGKKNKLNGVQQDKRKTEEPSSQPHKKKKSLNMEEMESEESDDEDEDAEGLDEMGEEDSEGGEEEEDEESEGSDEEEESGEEVEVEKTPPLSVPKKEKKKQPQTPTAGKASTPAGTPKTPKTPNGTVLKKEQNKAGGGQTPKGGTPASTPGGTKPEQTPKKTLEGGVGIKDVKIGNGAVVKAGKMATVYYVGRLKSNNKVFDSTQQGPGFKFRVGRGEVIKGWDVGLVGMKVGGKRLITCPPHMAYGQKGSPPAIPGNSTLIFEVELKGVQ